MQLLIDSFILLGISQLLTAAIYFAIHHRTRLGLLFIGLFFSLICYVSFRHSLLSLDALRILYQMSLLTPILLYAIARYLFIDGARMQWIDWLLIVYFVAMRIVFGGFYLQEANSTTPAIELIVAFIIPLGILIYFTAMAAFYTVRGYRADLLVNRRTLRVYFVFSALVFVMPRLVSGIIVYAYLLVSGVRLSVPDLPAVIEVIYLALLFLAFNLMIMRRHEGLAQLFNVPASFASAELREKPSQATVLEEPLREEETMVGKILELMVGQKLYTRQGVTIAELARRLEIPEQKLRQTINSEMGYRNFNQFLNHYRLDEAGHLLRSSQAPISNIAFDVGYSSLSSFNSVFKSRFGVTPTEYRLSGEAAGREAEIDAANG